MDFGAIRNWGQFRVLKADSPLQSVEVMQLDRTVWDYVGDYPEAVKVFEPPKVVTVSLAKLGTLGSNLDWLAEVSWGVGSQRQTLLCDWQHGVQLQVPATAISVRAVPYAPRATSMSAAGQSLQLSAQVGLGSLTGISPTLTQRMSGSIGLAPAASLIFEAPAFSRRASVYPGFPGSVASDPYASLRTAWVYPGGAHLCTVPGAALTAGRSMPIPGIANLEVTNIAVAGNMFPVVVWHLDA